MRLGVEDVAEGPEVEGPVAGGGAVVGGGASSSCRRARSRRTRRRRTYGDAADVDEYEETYERRRLHEWVRLNFTQEALDNLKKAIRSKPAWEEEFCDDRIVKKFRREATEQGIAPEVVKEAFEHLQAEASYIRGDHNASKPSTSPASSSNINSATIFQTQFENLLTSVAAMQAKITAMPKEEHLEDRNMAVMVRDGHFEEKSHAVWYLDNVVPPKLREILATRLDAIADLPDKSFRPKSYNHVDRLDAKLHTGHGKDLQYLKSNSQVQDLIQPSLFPYIENVSPVLDKSTLPPTSHTQCSRQYEDAKYQWLPSQFRVGLDGSVKITSYINNLEKEANEELYKVIELIFGIFLPMFEKILSPKNLRGRDLQVIVEAANYVIQPNGAACEGDWHIEGMSHEHIVASGIYYYSTSPWLKDDGLEFRRHRDEKTDCPEMAKYGISNLRPEDEEMYNKVLLLGELEYNILLGAIPVVENRLLVFGNELQHKVTRILNDSPHQVGMRKTLVFYLVDPDVEIVSTKHIPEQQVERRALQLRGVMSEVAFRVSGKEFPEEIVENIVSRASSGLTMVEARRHRLELMIERQNKVYQDDEEWGTTYAIWEN